MGSMTYTPQISAKQLGFLLMTVRVPMMTVFLPLIGGHAQPKDAWISALIASGGGMLITWLIVQLCHRHPRQTLIQMSISLLGRWVGGLLAFLFLWFYLHTAYLAVRKFAEIINNAVMPETPIPFLILFIVGFVIFAVYRGLEAIANVNTITLPITLAFLFLIFLLLAHDVHLDALKPSLESGWKPVLLGSLVALAAYGEVILIPVLYPYVKDQEKVLSYSLVAVGVSALLLVCLSVYVVGVFGAMEASNLTLPVFSLVRMVSVADFLERIESVMVGVWISLIFTKVCVFLYSGVVGVGQWLKLKNYKCFIIPMAVCMMILADQSFNSIAEYKSFIASNHFVVYVLTIVFIFPAILLLVSLFRQRKGVS